MGGGGGAGRSWGVACLVHALLLLPQPLVLLLDELQPSLLLLLHLPGLAQRPLPLLQLLRSHLREGPGVSGGGCGGLRGHPPPAQPPGTWLMLSTSSARSLVRRAAALILSFSSLSSWRSRSTASLSAAS